jgi:DNA (cytosine-5)-methyltransferase 1
LKNYTITEISALSGLSKKEIRKHLIAQTLKNIKTSSGYNIEEDDLQFWLNNIPTIESEQLDSIFRNADEINICADPHYLKDISKILRNDNWKKNKLNGIKFADFFCGAGGLSLGLVMAGYEPVLGVEINETAYETYLKNLGTRFKKLRRFPNLDITINKNKKEIIQYLKNEAINVICGGFPCQGFSLSGSRVISDPRNTLYCDMLEIVNEVKPDFIIMENVVGITTIFDGKVLKKIIKDYKDIHRK